ncbi:MAG TPA: U32 family peptidase [Candidatus Scybalousia intestinigallinarum]|jgi:putative protease|nr:U32 family peptidase [Candidatus Scybalousia intestinigallinarum]
MQYIVVPQDKQEIKFYQEKGVNHFLFGLKNYSVHYPELTLEEIKELSKESELFIAMNKNIFNEELEEVERLLIELEKTNIKGIFFYDLAILSMVRRKQLALDLVWNQTHMVTNYNTCNYYFEKGVKYGLIANEVTLEEIIEMKKKTKMQLIVQIMGYPSMSHSRRMLISNYFKSMGKAKQKEQYTLQDHTNPENDYLITEDKTGTSLFFGKIINGTKALPELIRSNLDYGLLDTSFIPMDTSLQVLELFNEIKEKVEIGDDIDLEKYLEKTASLIGDSTNFFYQKTIYKVKKGK